jgi:hypothetical protein
MKSSFHEMRESLKYLTGRLPSFSPEILCKHLAEQEEIPLQNI